MTYRLKLNPEGSAGKSLFLGNILEENLFPYPHHKPEESETVRLVLESVDGFMSDKGEQFHAWDLKGELPKEFISGLKELGLFGIIIPEEYGGVGLNASAYARIIEQVSRYDASASLTIGAHSSIGMKGLLLFGTPEQKAKYLPRLASGEMLAAFCLTEAGAGSDAASIRTHAERNADGSWVLNGEKIWITNGPLADFFTVFAKTDTPEGKITAFIVERGYPGVSSGQKEDKMGIRASATSSVAFQNVVLPPESVLGPVGQGFKVAMSILNNGRTGLGGGCLGGMKASIARAVQFAQERKQFGKKLAEFQLIQDKLVQMNVACFAAESVIGMVGHYIDSGVEDYSVEAAVSKIVATEAMWFCANEALQIAGGTGYMRELPYERVVRDCRINMIFEGTNEILRLYIALSGLKDAGAYLQNLKKGAAAIFNDPIKGFGVLSSYAARKLSQLTSIGEDRLAYVHPLLRSQSAIMESYTSRLGRASETVLIRLNKRIPEEQLITRRLADTAIDLFTGLCVLSRVSRTIEEKGEERSKADAAVARIFCQHAKRRMNQNLRRLIRNEDAPVQELAADILQRGGYHWDLYE